MHSEGNSHKTLCCSRIGSVTKIKASCLLPSKYDEIAYIIVTDKRATNGMGRGNCQEHGGLICKLAYDRSSVAIVKNRAVTIKTRTPILRHPAWKSRRGFIGESPLWPCR